MQTVVKMQFSFVTNRKGSYITCVTLLHGSNEENVQTYSVHDIRNTKILQIQVAKYKVLIKKFTNDLST